MELCSYLDFAIETAYLAGRLTLGYFQTGVRPDFKADDTPITVADRKAEELIRACIEKRYPRHAIVGEEYGTTENEDASHRWFIDPIDGTKPFLRGVPLYAVLIGLGTKCHSGKQTTNSSCFTRAGMNTSTIVTRRFTRSGTE